MPFDLSTRLAERRAAHLYRQRPLLETPQGVHVVVDGKPLLAFCNNDYLAWPIIPRLSRLLPRVRGAGAWAVAPRISW